MIGVDASSITLLLSRPRKAIIIIIHCTIYSINSDSTWSSW
jgi:hypothetical protein